MTTTNNAVSRLRAKRERLLAQLARIDHALDALSPGGAPPAASHRPADPPANSVVPTKLKAPKTLSDDHKHALIEGRRKARHAKDAAAGIARELLDSRAGLAPTRAGGREPRLVKRR